MIKISEEIASRETIRSVFPNLFLASVPISDKQIPIAPLPVACRGLLMPGASAWLYAPLPNASVGQWHMVVFVTGHTLFVTLQHDVMFLSANQPFGEVADQCSHF